MELPNSKPMAFKMPLERTALVMIDMQRDFIQKGGYGYLQCNSEEIFNEVSKIIEPCKQTLNAARKLGITVIHTREGHEPDLRDLAPSKRLRQYLAKPENYEFLIGDKGPMGKLLVRGEYGHDLVDDLLPIEGEIVIDKPGKGTFYNTDVHQILVTRGITHLLFCGVTTECCVNTTFREANDHGFECCTLVNCTNGFNDAIVKETINTFCAYDGLLGYIGTGEDLVKLAEENKPNSLGLQVKYTDFMTVGINEETNLVKSIIDKGGNFMGTTDSIDEALNSVPVVLAVNDSNLNSKNIIFTPSSGALSLQGTNHTMFGAVSIISTDFKQIRHYFATEILHDEQDELSKHYYEFPMKPVDFRGIENHYQYASIDSVDINGKKVDFDIDLFFDIYNFKDLLTQELYLIGKSEVNVTPKCRYIELLLKKQKILSNLQPKTAPHIIVFKSNEKIDVICRLLGFPSVTMGGFTYVAEFGLDGILLDICQKL